MSTIPSLNSSFSFSNQTAAAWLDRSDTPDLDETVAEGAHSVVSTDTTRLANSIFNEDAATPTFSVNTERRVYVLDSPSSVSSSVSSNSPASIFESPHIKFIRSFVSEIIHLADEFLSLGVGVKSWRIERMKQIFQGVNEKLEAIANSSKNHSNTLENHIRSIKNCFNAIKYSLDNFSEKQIKSQLKTWNIESIKYCSSIVNGIFDQIELNSNPSIEYYGDIIRFFIIEISNYSKKNKNDKNQIIEVYNPIVRYCLTFISHSIDFISPDLNSILERHLNLIHVSLDEIIKSIIDLTQIEVNIQILRARLYQIKDYKETIENNLCCILQTIYNQAIILNLTQLEASKQREESSVILGSFTDSIEHSINAMTNARENFYVKRKKNGKDAKEGLSSEGKKLISKSECALNITLSAIKIFINCNLPSTLNKNELEIHANRIQKQIDKITLTRTTLTSKGRLNEKGQNQIERCESRMRSSLSNIRKIISDIAQPLDSVDSQKVSQEVNLEHSIQSIQASIDTIVKVRDDDLISKEEHTSVDIALSNIKQMLGSMAALQSSDRVNVPSLSDLSLIDLNSILKNHIESIENCFQKFTHKKNRAFSKEKPIDQKIETKIKKYETKLSSSLLSINEFINKDPNISLRLKNILNHINFIQKYIDQMMRDRSNIQNHTKDNKTHRYLLIEHTRTIKNSLQVITASFDTNPSHDILFALKHQIGAIRSSVDKISFAKNNYIIKIGHINTNGKQEICNQELVINKCLVNIILITEINKFPQTFKSNLEKQIVIIQKSIDAVTTIRNNRLTTRGEIERSQKAKIETSENTINDSLLIIEKLTNELQSEQSTHSDEQADQIVEVVVSDPAKQGPNLADLVHSVQRSIEEITHIKNSILGNGNMNIEQKKQIEKCDAFTKEIIEHIETPTVLGMEPAKKKRKISTQSPSPNSHEFLEGVES